MGFDNPWTGNDSGTSGNGQFVNPWTSGALDTSGGVSPYHMTPDDMQTLSKAQGNSVASQLNAAANGGGNGFSGVGDFFSNLGQGFANATSILPKALETIGLAVGDPIKSLVEGQPVNTFKDIGDLWSQPGTQTWSDAGNAAKELYTRSKGALEGGVAGAYSELPSMLQSIGNGGLLSYLGNEAASTGKGIAHGWENPTGEDQAYNQGINTLSSPLPKSIAWAPRFAAEAATDPLSYVPVGEAAGLAGRLIKGASDAVGATPYIADALNALKGSAPAQALLNSTNILSEPFKAGWNRYLSTNAVDRQQALNNIQDIFKGTTPEERQAVTHIIEQAPGHEDLLTQMPHLQDIIDRVNQLKDASGKAVFDRGIIKNMNENYMPHILSAKFDDGGGIFANASRPMKPYLSSSKGRSIDGTISEINQRAANGEFDDLFNKLGIENKGKLFEDDAAKLLTAHVLQNSKAQNLYDFIHNTVIPNAEKITDIPAVIPEGKGMYRPDTFKFFPQMVSDRNVGEEAINGMVPLEELHPGMAVSSNTPAYLMNKADAEFMNGAFRPNPPSNMNPLMQALVNGASKGLAGVNALARTTMLYNPFVHILNNVPWQVYLKDPGALNPFGEGGWGKYVNEAANGAQEGTMFERAAKAGALSAPHSEFNGGIHDIANQLVDSLNPSRPSALSMLKNVVTAPYKLSNAATWIPEHAIRANMFERGVGKGLSEEEAAKEVNGVLGNHQNLTKGEQNIQKYVFPFYNWMKTSLTSNAKALYNQTPKFTIPYHLLNAVNEENTGHSMVDNPQGKKLSIGLPFHNDQGNQFYLSLYNPALELMKIGEQGPVDFAFRRTNPIDKMMVAAATGKQDPFADHPYNVVQYPDLPGGASNPANEKGLFFGNKGPMVNPWIATAAQTIGNPVSGVGDTMNGTAPENIARLFGSYGSYYDPQKAEKNQQYQNRQSILEQIQYLRHSGQQVPKTMKKEAYRKIQMPNIFNQASNQ